LVYTPYYKHQTPEFFLNGTFQSPTKIIFGNINEPVICA
jgi:hypothetical protein